MCNPSNISKPPPTEPRAERSAAAGTQCDEATIATDQVQSKPKWTEVTGAIAQAVQVIALITAAIWTLIIYYQTREAQSRAEVVQDITSFPLTADDNLLHINVRVKNIGKVVVEPRVGEIKVQQICPLAGCDGPDPLGRPYPKSAILARTDPASEKYPEAPWPEVSYRGSWLPEGQMVLEPGETNMRSIDFLVPRYISLVRVFTFVSEKEAGNIGWPSEAIHKMPTGSNQHDECGSVFGGGASSDRTSTSSIRAGDSQ